MRTLYILLIALVAFSKANGQQPVTSAKPDTLRMTVKQSIEYALQHEHDVKNSRLDAEIARRNSQEYTGLAFPQIKCDRRRRGLAIDF